MSFNLYFLEKNHLYISPIITERLELIPLTYNICDAILQHQFNWLVPLNLKKGINWPDDDTMESLPRTSKLLSKLHFPTGFESWMIVKRDTREIIGDVGFKGYNFIQDSCDLGYGIIEAERKKGYAYEACNALIQWAWQTESLKLITAVTLPSNEGSIRLLKKLNFKIIAQDEEFLYWEVLR